MENLALTYSIKLHELKERIIQRFLSWLEITINQYKLKKRWNYVLDQNYHSGYIIEAIQLKLISMINNWPEYKYSDNQISKIRELIQESERLLLILTEEEKESHARSSDYLIKQKAFFRKLDLYLQDLFY